MHGTFSKLWNTICIRSEYFCAKVLCNLEQLVIWDLYERFQQDVNLYEFSSAKQIFYQSDYYILGSNF